MYVLFTCAYNCLTGVKLDMCGALVCLMAEKTSLSCRKLSFTQQVVDVTQGSCTQHEKCHDLISCIPSTRAWLNCTSTCFMHVACMHSTCIYVLCKHTCIRLHGHMHTFSISCRHLDHIIWYVIHTCSNQLIVTCGPTVVTKQPSSCNTSWCEIHVCLGQP